MKYGKFITHPDLAGKKYDHPWENKQDKFNSYARAFEPGSGILNVKCVFSPAPARKAEKITVRATSLGIFDMFVNGFRVSADEAGNITDELKPGWTDYRSRVFEFEYDITSLCEEKNVFVAEVSPGWWTGRISFGFYGFRPTAFCGEIEITYEDGETEILASGTDWEASVCGPVLRADIWDGEYYDARIPEPSLHPEAHTWVPAALSGDFTGEIVPFEGEPIRICDEMTRFPQSAVIHGGTEPNGTAYGKIRVLSKKVGSRCETAHLEKGQAMILDFGQDMVGWPTLFLKAPRGTRIDVYFAEILNDTGDPNRGNDGPEGSMYIKNYRSALARLTYVAAGLDDVEVFFPTHAFFGFRYAEIRADADIDVFVVMGNVLRSAVPETGSFTCDNPEVNQLFHNTLWGMRSNYLSVPTDCPQRDERLGWTGDTQMFCGAASYIGYTQKFLRKWLRDARDSQEGYEGSYCDVIPRIFDNTVQSGNAAWGDAGLIVPDRLFLMYNDEETLRTHYDSMEAYMTYLSRFGLKGAQTAYGDWLNYDVTDKRYIAVCYYAYDAALMAKFSDILGKADRAAYYRDLYSQVRAHWAEKYLDGDRLTVDTQTGYLLPLHFGMVEGALRETFIRGLEKKITDNDFTLSTGFVGTGILNQTLSECGLDKLAYSLLMQTRDPSWLYPVRQGATTMWERWNSYTGEKGFGDVGMNSFNHYAYGAVCEWLFADVCGIRPDPEAPGFEHFILRPTPDFRTDAELPAGQKQMRRARASYAALPCEQGDAIESGWELVNGAYVYSFVIPEGLSARVELPAGDSLKVNDLCCTPEELGGCRKDGRCVFELDAGVYKIEIK